MKLIWGAFLGVGLIIGVVGAMLLVSRIQFVSKAEHVDGRVTSVHSYRTKPTAKQRREGKRPQTRYKSKVTYVVAGETYQINSEVSSSSPPQTGRVVQVAYDPAAPETAHIHSVGELWVLPILFIVIGLAFVVIGGAGFWRLLRGGT